MQGEHGLLDTFFAFQSDAELRMQGLQLNPRDPRVVVQPGEVEVTNPENGALPEVLVLVPVNNDRIEVVRQRFATLTQPRAVLSDPELTVLYRAAEQVESHFAQLYQAGLADFALDIEFKFRGAEHKLLIKQARPYSMR